LLASGALDNTIRLWDMHQKNCVKILRGHTRAIWSVAFSQDGKMLVSGSDDCTIRLWDIMTGECLQILQGHSRAVWDAEFIHDNRQVVSCSDDYAVRVWDVSTGVCIKSLQCPDSSTGSLYALTVTPDHMTLFSGGNRKIICMWDIETGLCRCLPNKKEQSRHRDKIVDVHASPKDRILASGSNDGTIKLWNILSGENIRTLHPPRPYEGMNIIGATGLTDAQRETLKALGAVDETS
jgi:WD40 repeat protein